MTKTRSVMNPSPPPSTDVEHLLRRVRDFLSVPNPGMFYTLLGAVAANLIEGEPCWLMLVGPSSSGKTEALNTTLGIPGVIEAVRINNESAFLSATSEKEKSADSTGGLLREVGSQGGAIVINDFTSILTLQQHIRDGVMSVFREAYQGKWSRHVGSEGGRVLQWQGKLALFAGVTPEIDKYHDVSAALGERWIYYRLDHEDGFQRSMMLLSNDPTGKWREELRLLIGNFFYALHLEFGALEKRTEMIVRDRMRIIQYAKFAATCRSAVQRDPFSKVVTGLSQTEYETRLAGSLYQLAVGMARVGVQPPEMWRLIGKVALDSMPELRKIVIIAAYRSGSEGVPYSEIHSQTGVAVSVIKRAAEDLIIHRVMERVGSDRVKLTEEMSKEVKALWGQL